MNELFEIIHEDDHLLVVNKPADLVCHPTKTDARSSLIGRVRLHLGEGGPAHLINRLDRETSGLVLVAKCDDVARELRRLWENHKVRKKYLALVHGHMAQNTGEIDVPLGRDEHSRVAIKDCVRPDGTPAVTQFETRRLLEHKEGCFSLLDVTPQTGRKHQIRIHLSHIGHPIVGDKLYGKSEDYYLALVERRMTDGIRSELLLPCHALHAGELTFLWRGSDWAFMANPEPWFLQFIEGVRHSNR